MKKSFKNGDLVDFSLLGIDGNAFVIVGAFSNAAKKHGFDSGEINQVLEEAKSGDYDHLLQTIIKHTK